MAQTSAKTTALVTGGAGFIGSHLVERLLAEGYRVVVVDDLSTGSAANVPAEAVLRQVDISDPAVARVFEEEKPELVFHLAAQIDLRKSMEDPAADALTNVIGSLRVIDGAVRCGAKKFIFSSSGGAAYHAPTVIPTPESVPVGPVSPYGAAKMSVELYLNGARHARGLRSVALRYANVYGPRQGQKGEAGVIGLFAMRFLRGATPTVFGDGEQTRDFVFVDDVVAANLAAARSDREGIFNIGTGIETSVNRIVELVRRETGGPVPLRGPAIAAEERRSALDSSAALRDLGWKPAVPLEEGIRRTVRWFRERAKLEA